MTLFHLIIYSVSTVLLLVTVTLTSYVCKTVLLLGYALVLFILSPSLEHPAQ